MGGPVASVRSQQSIHSIQDPIRLMQQVDLQEQAPPGKILADLTNPTGRRSLVGDIRNVEHFLPPASDQTSEISVDLQSSVSAARNPSQVSDMKRSWTQRSSVISNVGAKVQVDLT